MYIADAFSYNNFLAMMYVLPYCLYLFLYIEDMKIKGTVIRVYTHKLLTDVVACRSRADTKVIDHLIGPFYILVNRVRYLYSLLLWV